MNLKKASFKSSFFILLCTLFFSSASFGQTQMIDTAKSKIRWTGKKLTGEHSGFVKAAEGNVHYDFGKISTAYLKVDMNSISCTDIEDPEYNKKLVKHLKDPDFFDVPNNPYALINIEEITWQEGYAKGEAFSTITIKGIEKPLRFMINKESKSNKAILSGKAVIDRTDYGITYKSASVFQNLGDKIIEDDFDLDFVIYFTKPTRL